MVGPKVLKEYLINYARPLIYSTFTSFSNLASVKSAYQMLIAGETVELVQKVRSLISHFRTTINIPPHIHLLPSESPIQGLVMDGNARVNALSQQLIQAGLNVKPIRFPTVPKGKERVRICLHSHNTIEQVDMLIRIVEEWVKKEERDVGAIVPLPASLDTTTATEAPAATSAGSAASLSVSTLSAFTKKPSIPSKL
ncbi:5-aminolevulinate synthase, nonspecific, mitochondrial [Linnemannia elongata]|nr:5-aminolevulinate synthase, nonspecific, mitochondrial [Linnemannia elongata]